MPHTCGRQRVPGSICTSHESFEAAFGWAGLARSCGPLLREASTEVDLLFWTQAQGPSRCEEVTFRELSGPLWSSATPAEVGAKSTLRTQAICRGRPRATAPSRSTGSYGWPSSSDRLRIPGWGVQQLAGLMTPPVTTDIPWHQEGSPPSRLVRPGSRKGCQVLQDSPDALRRCRPAGDDLLQ